MGSELSSVPVLVKPQLCDSSLLTGSIHGSPLDSLLPQLEYGFAGGTSSASLRTMISLPILQSSLPG